jgi:hypothetical protein
LQHFDFFQLISESFEHQILFFTFSLRLAEWNSFGELWQNPKKKWKHFSTVQVPALSTRKLLSSRNFSLEGLCFCLMENREFLMALKLSSGEITKSRPTVRIFGPQWQIMNNCRKGSAGKRPETSVLVQFGSLENERNIANRKCFTAQ